MVGKVSQTTALLELSVFTQVLIIALFVAAAGTVAAGVHRASDKYDPLPSRLRALVYGLSGALALAGLAQALRLLLVINQAA